ncbi:MAG TPA: cytochrome c maturation protein CcmE [candidate division Zixibacteria bacterium]|nr:cytochrome c maturation protein CcmE [candidate division Zixibacteria bacterium]MDD4917851.1 cytochrome c maturation protein CcmE [candidate division Zixibacteria bacterium]MDM7973537.1 cytochrome c maturation protein CcmE [candidate division Zixibacteria bacterium]HOD67403.1 cytochrome c maturation protein CcmE [candidate division Zixibacteria bacterium]HPM38089.1 cytochrome c maturation protein CcmE [candidate division Zixibacteria bacterium]
MNAKYLIGGVIVVIFMVWGASAFFKTTIQYVSIEEAKAADRTVQVLGKIDFEAVKYNAADSRLEFAVYDAEAADPHAAARMNVVYYGVVPGNFDQATQVVLKGKSENGHFVANQMLVKCPSKYQGEGGDEYQDIQKHNQAVENSGV